MEDMLHPRGSTHALNPRIRRGLNVPSWLYGGTALSRAASMGHAAVVDRLLQLGASATLQATALRPLHGSWHPLMCATIHTGRFPERLPGYVATLGLLVAAGASPEAVEDDVSVLRRGPQSSVGSLLRSCRSSSKRAGRGSGAGRGASPRWSAGGAER